MVWFWMFILFVCGGLSLLYMWYMNRFNHWTRKGIDGPKPTLVFGNIFELFTGKKNIGDIYNDVYNSTKHCKFCGVFMMHRPTLIINDLDLIKEILIKDFTHFSDHTFPTDTKVEPLSGHLLLLSGEKWKNLRNKLTPTFTTSKLKNMFDVVAECATEMIKYLNEQTAYNGVTDMKEVMAKMNTDVIGSCAFGIECNSFKNPDAEFRQMGKKIFKPTLYNSIMRFALFFMPEIMKIYKKSILGKELTDFFYNTVNNTIKYREDNDIHRNDFLQLLIQLKNNGAIENETGEIINDGTRLTTMQVAAQVFVFFIAGFETSSSTASFALYELCLNPDIQNIARKEIDEVLVKHDNKITYDALGEMTYLHKVIEETLRKYPPLPLLFRVCTKNYLIPGTNITIEKDTPVMVPIHGIQTDPQYFPEPTKFDPERFTPEKKAARHSCSYLPFGDGPRTCIGSRFGLMQVKLGLVSLLSTYELSVCEKTNIPIIYDKKAIMTTVEGGLWLNLKKRTK